MYTEKVPKRFYMDNTHHLNTPMVVRSLNAKNNPFWPPEKDEEILGSKVSYLSAIEELMYLQIAQDQVYLL